MHVALSLCVFVVSAFLHFCIDVPLQRLGDCSGGMGLRMAWVEAWLRGCMLIVSGGGQGLVLDEPERHLAGECRRDEWAVILVSACCPFSLRICGFCIDVPLQRWVYFGGYGGCGWHG